MDCQRWRGYSKSSIFVLKCQIVPCPCLSIATTAFIYESSKNNEVLRRHIVSTLIIALMLQAMLVSARFANISVDYELVLLVLDSLGLRGIPAPCS